MLMQPRLVAAIALVAAVGPLAAQQQQGAPRAAAAKPTLAHADYLKWETLGAAALSPDGRFVAYDFRRGDGSTELRYRAVDGEEHAVRSATSPEFTANNHWLLFTITPDTAGGRGGRGGAAGARGGRGAGGQNQQQNGAAPAPQRNKVGVVDLRTGEQTTFDDVQSFTLSDDGSHVALRRYPATGKHVVDVIVRDLDAGTELTFGNVADLQWSDDGALLALAIDVDAGVGSGVQVLDTRTNTVRSLDASAAQYSALAWRDKSDDLAAMRSRTDTAFNDTSYVVLAWRNVGGSTTKQTYDFTTDRSFPSAMRVTAYRTPEWSDDGKTIFFGIADRDPKRTPERNADGLPPARVQVWHYKDVREYHQQEVNAAQDRRRTSLVAWQPGANGIVRLTTDPFESVQIISSAGAVVATDQAPYPQDYMSGRASSDVYVIDPASGKRDRILTRSHFPAAVSPDGRVALYQENGQWWSLNLQSGVRTNLTGKAGSVFVDMEDDHPVPERRAYGLAAYTSDGRSAIVYDRFDLWKVNLDGSAPTRLTRGREDSTVYRCVTEGFGRGGRGGRGGAAVATRSAPCQLGNESLTIDLAKPLIVSATGAFTKKSGYSKIVIGQPAQRLVWLDKQVSGLRKAKDADVYLLEQQTAEESPNYFVTDAALANGKQVSHTNAFQNEFAWGKQVLMPYTNGRGDKLQMMLTYPANYEPGKKYPMVVYYYEELSQGFHQYVVPSERSPYNTSLFSQNGYFVLRPDIRFQPRNPGYSGLDCVTSAVKTVLARVPDIDAKRVGNMGHSWGGYQSAFYAVHNHGTFAATIAGAPLTDLISFYGYTSGNSGLPESGHFETSQERMQVSLWEDPQAYIRNSTVFAMDSLHTPLLLEEGSADGNVNPFQSQEVYNFGRRLGKQVVYLIYEDENHNVARPESQADYTKRQLEWFGHYLKGEPAAAWITDGESFEARARIKKDGGAQAPRPVQAGSARQP
jgi:Tol biopolymer transport system component